MPRYQRRCRPEGQEDAPGLFILPESCVFGKPADGRLFLKATIDNRPAVVYDLPTDPI